MNNTEKLTVVLNAVNENYCDGLKEIKESLTKKIFIADFQNRYGIFLKEDSIRNNGDIWQKVPSYYGDMSIGSYGKKYNRKVWNNKQNVEEEILLQICFPTGAYIFGDDYPTDFFENFYNELKTYHPKYCDDINHGLYFSMDNALVFLCDFDDICRKYAKENRRDRERRRIEQLRRQADELEKSLINDK